MAVVLAVGILSIGAELVGTWTWFFRLERTTAAVVPVTAALLVLAVSSALTLVFTVTD